mgnify:CR=1 FL=1
MTRVRDTIQRYEMIAADELVIAGVSGGPDSLTMLYLLKELAQELHFQVHVAHLDHSFRGKEAEEEARWIKETARDWGLRCTLAKRDVPALAKEKGLSPEDAGRLARQEFFLELAHTMKARKIALGHQADDQAETVLMHFLIGSGLQGLQGILPVRGPFIRPLLFIKRKEIEEFCRQRGLEARKDPSNRENIYLRNRIRNQLMPWLLENINPNLVDTLNRNAHVLAADEAFLQEKTREIIKRYITASEDQAVFSLHKWDTIPLSLQRRLIRHAWMLIGQKQGLTYLHVEEIRRLADGGQVGKMLHLPGKTVVEKNYGSLIFYPRKKTKKPDPIMERQLAIPGETFIPETRQVIVAKISSCVPESLDNQSIYLPWRGMPPKLYSRSRREGDRFSPRGLHGSKKLKDYYIEKKIPQKNRDRILLIADDREVIWVPGWGVGGKCNTIEENAHYVTLSVVDIMNKPDLGAGKTE